MCACVCERERGEFLKMDNKFRTALFSDGFGGGFDLAQGSE